MSDTPTVLLDLDGTILDSTVPFVDCVNHALALEGLAPRTVAELRRFIGPPLHETFSILTDAAVDAPVVDRLIAGYRSIYPERAIELALAYDGIPETVAALADRGAVGVVTAKPRSYAAPIVEALGLARYMAVIDGPGMTYETKDITLARALATLDLSPGSAVMVGDRATDVKAGLACGTRTVGVTWGFGDRAELEGAGAGEIVDRPGDLLHL